MAENSVYISAKMAEKLKGQSPMLDILLEATDVEGGVTLTNATFSNTGYTLQDVKAFIDRIANPKKPLRKTETVGNIRHYFNVKERFPGKVNESQFTFRQAEANLISSKNPYFAAQARNPNGSLTLSLANQLSGENTNGSFQIPRNNVRKFLRTIRNNARRGPKVSALAAAFGHSNLNNTTNTRLRTFYGMPAAPSRNVAKASLATIKTGEPRFRGSTRSMKNNKSSLSARLALERSEHPKGYNWSRFSKQALTKAHQKNARRNHKTRRRRN